MLNDNLAYLIAQFDGNMAYMDRCIANLFATLGALGIEDETLVVLVSDHGESLYDHECWFDHQGTYECTSAEQTYQTLYIASPDTAKGLQARELQTQRGAEVLLFNVEDIA